MSNEGNRHYRWPWVVLAVLLLALVLFVLWMRGAVEQVREYRFGQQETSQGQLVSASPSSNGRIGD